MLALNQVTIQFLPFFTFSLWANETLKSEVNQMSSIENRYIASSHGDLNGRRLLKKANCQALAESLNIRGRPDKLLSVGLSGAVGQKL